MHGDNKLDRLAQIVIDAPTQANRFYDGGEVIVKQNDARGGAFGMDYYDQKAKDLVKKYTQHDIQFLQTSIIIVYDMMALLKHDVNHTY